MFSLPHYAVIKDNYCLAYFGNSKEYLVQLKAFRPIIESHLPGLKVFISCRKDSMYLLKGEERILSKEELEEQKSSFAYLREINCNMDSHPIQEIMEESDLPLELSRPKLDQSWLSSVVLLTNGIQPTRSLSGEQIKTALNILKKTGFNEEQILINGDIKNADWVVGVENEHLFEAGIIGKKVTLIPTGLGTELFKKMFPHGEVMNLV